MTLTEFGEIVKSVSPLITALAAVFGAWLAYRGLDRWRTETLGKRKAEIAQETLALAYEMEEILQSARNPFVLAHEMGKKKVSQITLLQIQVLRLRRGFLHIKSFLHGFAVTVSLSPPCSDVTEKSIWTISGEFDLRLTGL
jgi:hypothetical protein